MSVNVSSGSLKVKMILALRLTVLALSAGSSETSSGILSEVVFGFLTGTITVPPQPDKNPDNRITNISK
jgi:hypothetical protein